MSVKTLVLVDRGRAREAAELLEWLELQRALGGSTTDAHFCIAAAAARLALGDPVHALNHLVDAEMSLRGQVGFWFAHLLPCALRIALAAGDRALAERLAGSLEPPLHPIADHATVAAKALMQRRRGTTKRRRPPSPTPPLAGTTSRRSTRRPRPCSDKGAAWWRSAERPRQHSRWRRRARSSDGSEPNRHWRRPRRCSVGRTQADSHYSPTGHASSQRRHHFMNPWLP